MPGLELECWFLLILINQKTKEKQVLQPLTWKAIILGELKHFARQMQEEATKAYYYSNTISFRNRTGVESTHTRFSREVARSSHTLFREVREFVLG